MAYHTYRVNHDYLRDELTLLKNQGRTYSLLRPKVERLLDSTSRDPDVMRLQEGFAFLSASVREKIEDTFPEISLPMLHLLSPNLLRPFPSMTIVEFSPINHSFSAEKIISEGKMILNESKNKNDLSIQNRNEEKEAAKDDFCRFRTTKSVSIYPLERTDLKYNQSEEAPKIQIDFHTQNGVPLSQLNLQVLDFFLGETSFESQTLYLWLHHYLKSIQILVNDQYLSVPLHHLVSSGWDIKERIFLNQNSNQNSNQNASQINEGGRLLTEYFAYPDIFSFIKLTALKDYFKTIEQSAFSLIFNFKKSLPVDCTLNPLMHFRLYCSAAINLFPLRADPIHLDVKTELEPYYCVYPLNQNETPL